MERALSLLATAALAAALTGALAAALATTLTATLAAALATTLTAALATALTTALAATLAAALATTLAAALTDTLVAALSTAGGRDVLLHLATAGRRSVLLHLAAVFDFSSAGFRSRYRRAAANDSATLDVFARAASIVREPLRCGRNVAPQVRSSSSASHIRRPSRGCAARQNRSDTSRARASH